MLHSRIAQSQAFRMEQLLEMLDAQLRWPKEKSWAEQKALRTRLDLLLTHSMMLRSEMTRSAELSDFSSLDLPNEGDLRRYSDAE
jgi:hypothetical protein